MMLRTFKSKVVSLPGLRENLARFHKHCGACLVFCRHLSLMRHQYSLDLNTVTHHIGEKSVAHSESFPMRRVRNCVRLYNNGTCNKGPPWRVLFLGTDQYALHHLKFLHSKGENPEFPLISKLHVAICTEKCPVKEYAFDHGLPVYRWPLPDIRGMYDVGVIVSFGHLIPTEVVNSFPFGMLNVHPSLLPAWRGASPIIHTVLSGQTCSGVSVISIQPKRFDTGPLLAQQTVDIPEGITSVGLADLMAEVGAPLFHLRAQLRGKNVKLLDMVPVSTYADPANGLLKDLPSDASPGTPYFHKPTDALCIKCKDGWVGFQRLVVRKTMSAAAFHNGYLTKDCSTKDLLFESVDNGLDHHWR